MQWDTLEPSTYEFLKENCRFDDLVGKAEDSLVPAVQLKYIRAVQNVLTIQYEFSVKFHNLFLEDVIANRINNSEQCAELIKVLSILLCHWKLMTKQNLMQLVDSLDIADKGKLIANVDSTKQVFEKFNGLFESNIINDIEVCESVDQLKLYLSRYNSIASYESIASLLAERFKYHLGQIEIKRKTWRKLLTRLVTDTKFYEQLPDEYTHKWVKQYSPVEYKLILNQKEYISTAPIQDSAWFTLVDIESRLAKGHTLYLHELAQLAKEPWFKTKRNSELIKFYTDIVHSLLNLCVESPSGDWEKAEIILTLSRLTKEPVEDRYIKLFCKQLTIVDLEKFAVILVNNYLKSMSHNDIVLRQVQFFYKHNPENLTFMLLIGLVNVFQKKQKSKGLLQIKSAIIQTNNFAHAVSIVQTAVKGTSSAVKREYRELMPWLFDRDR